MKRCTQCGVTKPTSDFHDDKRTGGKRPTCKPCYHAKTKEWRQHNVEKARAYGRKCVLKRRLREIDLNAADYKQMADDADGLCAICGNPQQLGPKQHRLVIDHSHETGEVRGLLCNRCNMGLGYFDDDPQRFRAAAQYLEDHIAAVAYSSSTPEERLSPARLGSDVHQWQNPQYFWAMSCGMWRR